MAGTSAAASDPGVSAGLVAHAASAAVMLVHAATGLPGQWASAPHDQRGIALRAAKVDQPASVPPGQWVSVTRAALALSVLHARLLMSSRHHLCLLMWVQPPILLSHRCRARRKSREAEIKDWGIITPSVEEQRNVVVTIKGQASQAASWAHAG